MLRYKQDCSLIFPYFYGEQYSVLEMVVRTFYGFLDWCCETIFCILKGIAKRYLVFRPVLWNGIRYSKGLCGKILGIQNDESGIWFSEWYCRRYPVSRTVLWRSIRYQGRSCGTVIVGVDPERFSVQHSYSIV